MTRTAAAALLLALGLGAVACGHPGAPAPGTVQVAVEVAGPVGPVEHVRVRVADADRPCEAPSGAAVTRPVDPAVARLGGRALPLGGPPVALATVTVPSGLHRACVTALDVSRRPVATCRRAEFMVPAAPGEPQAVAVRIRCGAADPAPAPVAEARRAPGADPGDGAPCDAICGAEALALLTDCEELLGEAAGRSCAEGLDGLAGACRASLCAAPAPPQPAACRASCVVRAVEQAAGCQAQGAGREPCGALAASAVARCEAACGRAARASAEGPRAGRPQVASAGAP